MNPLSPLSLLSALTVGISIAILTSYFEHTFRNILMLSVLSSIGTLIVIAAIARAKQVAA